MRYAPSGVISTLPTEKVDAGSLILRLASSLIRDAKTIDSELVRVEVLEHWRRPKVPGMSLQRYLGGGKMKVLKRKVESSTDIQIKVPHARWLVNI